MKNKVLIVLSTMFLSQVFFSCCDCPISETFENNYTNVSIIPYDTSGFNTEIVIDKVSKNTFGLGLLVNFETIKVASNFKKLSSLGFNSALAFSDCDCIGDEFNYPDPIDNFKISIIDTQTEQNMYVTENFKIYSYSNELITLNDFFNQRENWHDGFQIELVAYDSMPNSVIFMVEVFLESGKTFSNQTEIINFHE